MSVERYVLEMQALEGEVISAEGTDRAKISNYKAVQSTYSSFNADVHE